MLGQEAIHRGGQRQDPVEIRALRTEGAQLDPVDRADRLVEGTNGEPIEKGRRGAVEHEGMDDQPVPAGDLPSSATTGRHLQPGVGGDAERERGPLPEILHSGHPRRGVIAGPHVVRREPRRPSAGRHPPGHVDGHLLSRLERPRQGDAQTLPVEPEDRRCVPTHRPGVPRCTLRAAARAGRRSRGSEGRHIRRDSETRPTRTGSALPPPCILASSRDHGKRRRSCHGTAAARRDDSMFNGAKSGHGDWSKGRGAPAISLRVRGGIHGRVCSGEPERRPVRAEIAAGRGGH